ncbi:MAG: RagB/SusD family nutrient uptake outer membrane protein [Paludibacter sp.]|nr:RagB/SusD family nutrient uptake outer membrane protein [Paludibacter sp.]
MKTNKILFLIGVCCISLLSSCADNFLDKQPLSSVTPEQYLKSVDQLSAYNLNMYWNGVWPQLGGDPYAYEPGNDMSSGRNAENMYVKGQWKVGQTGGDWDFSKIYTANYFLQIVVPRFKAGTISGDPGLVSHNVGEMYFFRAALYFQKLQALGDFPIVKTTLPNELGPLVDASKRQPQNEVARFIISDLDSAILLMKNVSPDGHRNRLSQPVAQLLKSRVALYEATWLKYFKGTAYVPNGTGWPGATKDYNKNYAFPSGSIDNEIAYFFKEAMTSAKIVADATPLTPNTGLVQQSLTDPINPYFNMFGDINLEPYSEILLWQRYDRALGVTNEQSMEAGYGTGGKGYTRGFVDGCLMTNGLPIYAAGSGYAGDDSIQFVRQNRDFRLQVDLKQPFQKNVLIFNSAGDHSTPIEPHPDIMNRFGHSDEPLGYCNRKGMNYDEAQDSNNGASGGEIVYRASEAYLNYIEACYESTGALDADADKYWKELRIRAGIDPDYEKTIAATDLNKEAANNWSVYSAGQMVDATLYNIRKERAVEFISEPGFRMNDLRRWRSLDQLITTPYHIEGFKLWGPMQAWYSGLLIYDGSDVATVSSPTISLYIRPMERAKTNLAYGGLQWTMAHYLNPIAVQHFLITSTNNDVSTSPIYQNPGWPITAGSPSTSGF